jgi:hypothetical protein
MAIPAEINERRVKDASDRDADLARRILAVPRLYASLTDEQAQVVRARVELRGKSWLDVAASLGLSRHAAMGRWRRGMERLPDVPGRDELQAMNTRLWDVML